MADVSKEEIQVLMETLQKYWPFNNKRYPKLNEDGSVTVTLSANDFVLWHLILHQADYLGQIAILLERNQHTKDWDTTSEDWQRIKNFAMSQAISGMRLFTTACGKPEEFAAYATRKTKKLKTKEVSEYEELADVIGKKEEEK